MGELRRVMGFRDLVLFNIVAIVGLRWVALAAAGGPSSLSLWVLALIAFFIPQGMAVARLGSAIPEEGGVYVWSQRAFGPRHGFIAGWCYWANNIIYYPTLLVALAGFASFIGGDATRPLEGSTLYVVLFSLAVLWIALGANILGLKTGRWIHNLGGLAAWIPALLLVVLGFLAWVKYGPANTITLKNVLPDLGSRDTISFFAEICFAFAGLELAAVLGGEIKNPRRNLHRAMIVSGIIITLIYILGTAAILVAVPGSEISIITGVLQAIASVGAKVGAPGLGGAVALLMTLGGIGGVGAWLGGSARILFVAGLEKYLPESLGRVHPRWGSPHVALLFQGILASFFIIAGSLGAGPQEIYMVLVDTTLLVYFIPYLYMFIALIRLDKGIRGMGGSSKVLDLPGGRLGVWFCGLLGFAAVTLAMILAILPPGGSANPSLHLIKVAGGTALFIISALILYERGRKRAETRGSGAAT